MGGQGKHVTRKPPEADRLQANVQRRFYRNLAWVGIAALALRVIYLSELSGEALVAVPIGDGWQYDLWAQSIARGDWLGTQAFYQTPLYPYLLAAIYAAFGHSLVAVRAVQAVFGAISCVFLGVAGRHFFSERVGLIAACLLAIYPWSIFSDGLIQKSSVDLFLMTSALASLAVFLFRPHWRWLIAAGLALGAFSLNRETGRLLYPIVVIWLLVYFRDQQAIRTRIMWAAVLTASMAVVVLPVGAYNYRASGEFLLSTSQLGPNFYIGNHAGASGIYEPLVPGGGSAERERDDAVRLAEQTTGRALSPTEVSDYWLGRSLEYIRSRPGDWLRLTGVKLLLTLNRAEVSDTESLDVYSEYSRLLAGLSWFDFGLVLPLAVFGIWQSRANWKRLTLLYALLLVLMLSVAAFFVLGRYRYPAVPVALLFAASGIFSIAQLRRDSVRHAIPGFLLATVAAVVAHVPLPSAYRDTTLFNVGLGYLKTDRPAEAIPWLQQAVQRARDDASAYFALGVAYDRVGQPQQAVEALRASVRQRPDDWETQNALGVALQGTGNHEQALPYLLEAVRLNPGAAAAHKNLGTTLSELGQHKRAIAAFRQSLQLRPDDPSTHNNLGLALQADGSLSEAVRELREAVRIKPDYAEAHANLALVLESSGAIGDATVHVEDALRLQPDNVGIQMNAAGILLRQGRIDDAIAHGRKAAILAPESIEVRYMLIEAYAKAGRLEELLVVLQEALALARSNAPPQEIARLEESIRRCREQLRAGRRQGRQ
jgi:tetratricopeptide (TPR) repeat protein/4-amino-4-deoxy-L-arabinose transferase-like glycosyltransferase